MGSFADGPSMVHQLNDETDMSENFELESIFQMIIKFLSFSKSNLRIIHGSSA